MTFSDRMSNQAKVKTLSHSFFNAKSRVKPVPASLWQRLVVRSEGTEVSELLENWGAADIKAEAVVSLLVSARENTGRITSSRLVVRGPLFSATEEDPIKANRIWPALDEDITLRFVVRGEALNFSNREARNQSVWGGLDTLPSFKAYRGNDLLSQDDIKTIPGLKDGASYRVAIQTHSVTHMAASLLVVPKPYAAVKAKARAWNVATESNQIPAIDLTDHWTRCGPNSSQQTDQPAVHRLPGLQARPPQSTDWPTRSPQTARPTSPANN